ncbi:MAG: PD-(D/E)XK nuclease family protein [Deltaproteobacteria bacterium]|nr:MAG: PD-(D/E)XK nuclease family protein [Deltaproteobacteria bacterium]
MTQEPSVYIARGARAAEAWLLGEIGACCDEARADPRRLARPARVVLPSRSLREHLGAAIVRHFGRPVAGVRLHTLYGLALEICERCDAASPSRAELLFPTVVRQQAREEPALREGLDALDDGYGAVTAVIADLLDAGFEPARSEALVELVASQHGAEARRAEALVRVAERTARALEPLGVGHRSALLRRALERLETDPETALPARAVWVHGFAEATGVAIDLIGALVRLRRARVVLDHPPDPAAADRPTSGIAFTKRLRERLAATGPTETLQIPGATPERIELLCAPGADAEVRGVADGIRALLDGGVEPEEIGVVARHLGMYRLPIRRHFGRLGIPFSGAPGTAGPAGPLARRAGAVADLVQQRADVPAERWLDAVESLPVQDARRGGEPTRRRLRGAPGADLRIGLHALGAARLRDVAQLRIDALVGASDAFPLPVRRGLVSLDTDDGDGAERDGESRAVRRRLHRPILEAAVESARALQARFQAWPERAGLDIHLRCLRALLAEGLGFRRGDTASDAILGTLDRIERDGAADFALSVGEFALLLRRALEEIGPAPLGGAGAGVAVLDVTAARARTFEHLFVLGLNRDVFPRSIVEDPLLSDALRRVLRARVPDLPIKETGHDEERYLFAQLVSASPHVTLSWQFVDEEGKERARSPLLERLCSALKLEPKRLASLTARANAVPGAPLRPASEHALLAGLHGSRDRFARLLPIALREACVDLATSGSSPETDALAAARMAVLCELDPDRRTADGRDRARRLGPYYGFVGCAVESADPRHKDIYVTAVEQMAACPWQVFVQRLLRVAATPDALEALPTVDRLGVGLVVHRTLERVARAGLERDAEPRSLDEAVALEPQRIAWPADDELERILEGAAEAVRRESGIGLAGFTRVLVERARPCVMAARAGGGELFVLGAEVDGSVEAVAGRRIHFKADLVERIGGALRLTDYKTGKTFAGQKRRETRERALASRVAAGERLQAVAYALGAGEPDACGRYLFLAPALDPAVASLEVTASNEPVARDFQRAVRTVLSGWDAGSFFPRLVKPEADAEPSRCGWCEVSQACLRGDSGARRRLHEWCAAHLDPARGAPSIPAGAAFAALWRLPATAPGAGSDAPERTE